MSERVTVRVGMTKHPKCECGAQAWRAIGTTGKFVKCRMCGRRWLIEVLHHVNAPSFLHR